MNQTLAERPISSGKPVVVPFREVKRAVIPGAPGRSLLQPAFGIGGIPLLSRWLQRMLYRRRLREAFRREPDSVLEDFGLTRAALDRFVATPFWRD